MALRLRKDVQKASYYVWFLGAEESRGLRGPRILHSSIPYLVDRARELEPIKVTLQVSHKGMKIIQGSSKHFITHSAITCSVQTEDIVACILLLYNPVTKCPLHVHAYRCDSETTAQALNAQLQVLINRPENQKRFAELETKLGLLGGSSPSPNSFPPKLPIKESKRNEDRTAKRFDSSLGSDTGTSTRESECSEENPPGSLLSPGQTVLYDSLAAELRAKLNGNGPPLLLPPRDYDTVHRSKGNLAATELRRCRNQLIVGAPTSKYGVSSRGSSGIGSDLAPSPERNEGHSSSDEDWLEKKQRKSDEHLGTNPRRPAVKPFKPVEKITMERPEAPPSYLYPLQKPAYIIPNSSSSSRLDRTSSYGKDSDRNYSPPKEEEIKPKLLRPRNLDFKEILNEKQFIPSDEVDEDDQDFNDDIQRFKKDNAKYMAERKNEKNKMKSDSGKSLQRTKSIPANTDHDYRYRRESDHHISKMKPGKYIDDEDIDDDENIRYRENMTDKQKYRESLIEKQRNAQNMYRERQLDDGFRVKEPTGHSLHDHGSKGSYKNKGKYEKDDFIEETTVDRKVYRQKSKMSGYDDPDAKFERNPYKEPGSLPYRESIERMIKSPAIRYKSFEDNGYRDIDFDEERLSDEKNRFIGYPLAEKYRDMRISQYSKDAQEFLDNPAMYNADERDRHISRQRYKDMKQRSQSRSPDTVMRVSPKDRFLNAKEKFKAIERERPFVVEKTSDRPYVVDKLSDRPYIVEKISDRPYMMEKMKNGRRMEPQRHASHEPIQHLNPRHLPPRQDPMLDWSSDEEQFIRAEESPPPPPPPVNRSREHYETNMSSRIAPSKSLGNLVKGYRHSYAEPRNPMPRNSGRVGLAAVNPY